MSIKPKSPSAKAGVIPPSDETTILVPQPQPQSQPTEIDDQKHITGQNEESGITQVKEGQLIIETQQQQEEQPQQILSSSNKKNTQQQQQQQRDKPMTIPIQDLNELRLQKKALIQQNQELDLQKQQKQQKNLLSQPEQPSSTPSNPSKKKFQGVINDLGVVGQGNNNSNLLLGVGRKGIQMLQTKQKFQSLLGKLLDLQTRDVANQQLQEMITENFSGEYLRMWMSSLQDYHSRPANFNSSETEILLIGFIAQVYGTKLLDPADKPPSVLKTSYKLCEMLQRYFYAKQVNESIQRACSESWGQIYTSCLKNMSVGNKEVVLYSSLKSIVTGGGDRVAQTTAVFVLEGFITKLSAVGMNEAALISQISTSFFSQIFVRNDIDTPYIIKAGQRIIEALHIRNLTQFIQQILQRSLTTLIDRNGHYKIKVAVCELLELLGNQFLEVTEIILGSYHEQVIQVLLGSSRDRILQVQASSKAALVPWQKLQQQLDSLESMKLEKDQPDISSAPEDIDEFIAKRTSTNSLLANKNQFAKPESVRNITRDGLDRSNGSQLYNKQGTWVQETRSRDFIKKKTGTGGGYSIIIGSQKPLGTSSQQNQNNLLREQIFNLKDQSPGNIRQNALRQTRDTNQNFYNMPNGNDETLIDDRVMEGNGGDINQGGQNNFKKSKIQSAQQGKRTIFAPQKDVQFEGGDDNDELSETIDFRETNRPTKKQQQQQQQAQLSQFEESRNTVTAGQRKQSYQQHQQLSHNSQLSDMWSICLEKADQGEYQAAFDTVINSGDDIYLIRLMLRNKNGFRHLDRQTQLKVIKKLIQFMQSNFLARLCLGFFKESAECGLTEHMQNTEQQQILEILHDMTQIRSDLGPQAGQLFAQMNTLFGNP